MINQTIHYAVTFPSSMSMQTHACPSTKKGISKGKEDA